MSSGGSDYHDATLEAIVVEWAEATAEVRLQLVGGSPAVLRFTALRSLHVPRLEPWGPSVSVNTVRAAAAPGGAVEVEMQSGDTIRVEAVWDRS